MGSKLRQKKANGNKMKQREQNGTSGRMNENFHLMKQNPKLKPKRAFSKGNNWRKRNMETKGKGANWGGSAGSRAAIRGRFSAVSRAKYRAVLRAPQPSAQISVQRSAQISARFPCRARAALLPPRVLPPFLLRSARCEFEGGGEGPYGAPGVGTEASASAERPKCGGRGGGNNGG